jgi:hypothetical protein
MNRLRIEQTATLPDTDWMPFPGGELEGRRPRALCPSCRSRKDLAANGPAVPPRPALCFQCYRAELERNRTIKAAADLDTSSEARFQTSLPFEPVNATRLATLKYERAGARATAHIGTGAFVEKRRRAQIEARHALARVFQGLKERQMLRADTGAREAALEAATRAAELQLPESWLPFVVAQ